MLVKVLFFAEFKSITGKEKEIFNLSENNLLGLLKLLFEKYDLKNLIGDEKSKKIHNNISIIINNQAILEKDPSLISLNEGDTITFLYPVFGG